MDLLPFLLILLSALFHASWNLGAKKASNNFAVSFLGMWAASIFFLPIFFFFPLSEIFSPQAFPFFITTGFVHCGYFYFLSKAYSSGEISVVYPIARGSGILFTVLLAFFVLQEKISLLGLVGIFLTLFGVLWIGFAKNTNPFHLKSMFLALLVGTSVSLYSLADKMGVQIVSPWIYIFWQYFLCAVFLTPIFLLSQQKKLLPDAWKHFKKYAVIIGIGSALTYVFVLFAFQIAPLSYVIALREIGIVIGAVFGFLFLKENFSWKKFLGILLIVAGVVFLKIA